MKLKLMCSALLLAGAQALQSAAAAYVPRQSAPAALTDTLRARVKGDRFDMVASIRGLPLGVRAALQTLFGSQSFDIALDIAEPGAKFQETDLVVFPKLPVRRLVAAGCSREYCLVYYERGGRAHTWHVALFHHTPAAARFEWGGIGPRALATIADVRNAVLAGAIKNSAGVWQHAADTVMKLRAAIGGLGLITATGCGTLRVDIVGESMAPTLKNG